MAGKGRARLPDGASLRGTRHPNTHVWGYLVKQTPAGPDAWFPFHWQATAWAWGWRPVLSAAAAGRLTSVVRDLDHQERQVRTTLDELKAELKGVL